MHKWAIVILWLIDLLIWLVVIPATLLLLISAALDGMKGLVKQLGEK